MKLLLAPPLRNEVIHGKVVGRNRRNLEEQSPHVKRFSTFTQVLIIERLAQIPCLRNESRACSVLARAAVARVDSETVCDIIDPEQHTGRRSGV